MLKVSSHNQVQKQVGALPYRKNGKVLEVLFVTSRETKRWVIPKGWPMRGKKDWNAAAQEAFEEAGVEGNMGRKSIGTYRYVKRRKAGDVECDVTVFLLEVMHRFSEWPESSERRRKWFPIAEAVKRVDEEGLQAIIQATLA